MKGLFVGLTSIDIIYPLNHFPEENTKNPSLNGLLDIGGPATNAAFTFAALGGKATLVSLIGQQPFRLFIKEKLEQYGIEHIDLNEQLNQIPVISSIVVNASTGSRTIVNFQPKTDIPVLSPQVNTDRFDIICVDGFFADYLLRVLESNRLRVPVVLDGGSYKPHTDQLLKFINYPIISERFTAPDGGAAGDYLRKKGLQRFAITRGEQPLEVFENGTTYYLPVPQVKAVDTLAAGDIFHGAFAKYIVEKDHNFKLALEMAARIASQSCAHLGPRQWVSSGRNP